MNLIFTNTETTNLSVVDGNHRSEIRIAKFTRVKPFNFHQFRKQNRLSKLSNIKLASFFNP